LGLRECRQIDNKGFLYLKNLRKLKHLDLSNTQINAQTLYKILQKNQEMRELHLERFQTDIDMVAIELKNLCQNLEVLNLKNAYKLTTQGTKALADCKNLRKVELK